MNGNDANKITWHSKRPTTSATNLIWQHYSIRTYNELRLMCRIVRLYLLLVYH